jgi:hypothetical protein
MNINKTCYAIMIALAGVFLADSAAAEIITASFDSRSETDGDPGPTNATTSDLAVGPVSAGRSFRTYLTFDLSGATAVGAGGSIELVLSHTTSSGAPNEVNASELAQTFSLFEVASDWSGTTAPGPEGVVLDTAAVTPAIGNHSDDLVFSSPDLVNAFNNAIGGNLYLGIKTNVENTNARSFVWYGSTEDSGNEPVLNTVLVPEPGSLALLSLGGLLIAASRRRGPAQIK